MIEVGKIEVMMQKINDQVQAGKALSSSGVTVEVSGNIVRYVLDIRFLNPRDVQKVAE